MTDASQGVRSPEQIAWRRLGVQLPLGPAGSYDCEVTGDPCIVWDESAGRWRMFYFAMGEMGGPGRCGCAVAMAADEGRGLPQGWKKQGLVPYENPGAFDGQTHKPFLLMDPSRPNEAVRLDGEYRLFSVTYVAGQKRVHVARSAELAGPWRVQGEPVIDVGASEAFDGLHADSVTAWWFADRGEILLFYKGYPRRPQADQPGAPYGSSLATALMRPGDRVARKLGQVLRPVNRPGHWLGGWVGPLQLLPARRGWWGLLSGSPSPPAPLEEQPSMREPAPSMGGWAYTPQAWPVTGWQALEKPIEDPRTMPPVAVAAGEGVNLWRHHALVLEDGGCAIYYNSGPYGREQMFGKVGRPGALPWA